MRSAAAAGADRKPNLHAGAKPNANQTPPIPITAGESLAVQKARARKITPDEYWANYFRNYTDKKDNKEQEELRETLMLLNANKKFKDVEAVLKWYLYYRNKNAEPWMYEALAMAIRMNKGKDEEVRKSLDYAADIAERDHNPNELVSAADMMFLMGYNLDRVGKLIDQATALVPHQANPLIMSINLAIKTRNPKRMADTVAKLLSLGWPGDDERVRRDARRAVLYLAKALHEDGRDKEADEMVATLPETEARDLYIRLSWTGKAGLDLKVEEPLGATASTMTPRTVFGGALVKNGHGAHPEDIYVCPRGFDGKYTIRVETFYNDPEKPATSATLEIITHEGTPQESKETRTLAIGDKPLAPVEIYLKGGRRKTALPFFAPPKLVPKAKTKKDTAGKR